MKSATELRTRFFVWAILVAALATTLAWELRRGLRIETDILALLPATEREPLVEERSREFIARTGRTIWLLVSCGEELEARAAATTLVAELRASSALQAVHLGVEEATEKAAFELYFPRRWQLLGAQTRRLLAAPDGGAAVAREATRILHSPLSGSVSRIIADDPLLLFPGFLQALPRPPGLLRPRDGMLVADLDDGHAVLVTAELDESPFARARATRAVAAVEAALAVTRERHVRVDVAWIGVARFAHTAAVTAETEALVIGIGSTLGVLLLLLVTFRSLRQLVLALLSIAVGLLSAVVVSALVFPSLHAITLGFGASLIGVSVDYSFHYLAARRVGDPAASPREALRVVMPGITLGAVTSALAYFGLAAAPLPGLRQMAVFSGAGLAGAFATVVLAYPALDRSRARAAGTPAPLRVARALLAAGGGRRWWRLGPLAILAGLAIFGASRLRIDDDIRLLQTVPEALARDDARLRAVSGDYGAGRFLLVTGASAEVVLEREERAVAALRADTSDAASLVAVSDFVPSAGRQVRDRELLRERVLGGDAILAAHLEELGFPEEASRQALVAVAAEVTDPLLVEEWLASPVSERLRHLWLGSRESGSASIVLLGGGIAPERVTALLADHEGVHLVDRVRGISGLLGRSRRQAAWLTVGAYALIAVLLAWRYGVRGAARVVLAPVLAAILALGVAAGLGLTVNIFTVLALLLVLGIGIDYTIFLAEGRRVDSGQTERDATALAIVLSATTTALSFGLLSLARTPVLQLFGVPVLAGIAAALLLAPLAAGGGTPRRKARSERDSPRRVEGQESGAPDRA